MVFRGCMNSKREQYYKKQKKKKREKRTNKGQHALMLKTLNNFITHLHLTLSCTSSIRTLVVTWVCLDFNKIFITYQKNDS